MRLQIPRILAVLGIFALALILAPGVAATEPADSATAAETATAVISAESTVEWTPPLPLVAPVMAVSPVATPQDAAGLVTPWRGPEAAPEGTPEPTPKSGSLFCCLNDWQGGVCSGGQRLASYCGSGCCTCGVFFCTSATSLCFH